MWDCNNHRGICLLGIAGKAFVSWILPYLQKSAERVYAESQCGSQSSTTDKIFSVRQLQQKCNEQNMPLYIAFIDFNKLISI